MDLLNNLEFSLVREPEIPEGKYQYSFANVELYQDVLTNYGVRDKILFTFELKSDNFTIMFEKCFYYSKFPLSRFMQFMTMVCNAYKCKKLNLNKLIGTSGTLTIVHETDKDGNIFESISSMEAYDIELAWIEMTEGGFE